MVLLKRLGGAAKASETETNRNLKWFWKVKKAHVQNSDVHNPTHIVRCRCGLTLKNNRNKAKLKSANLSNALESQHKANSITTDFETKSNNHRMMIHNIYEYSINLWCCQFRRAFFHIDNHGKSFALPSPNLQIKRLVFCCTQNATYHVLRKTNTY